MNQRAPILQIADYIKYWWLLAIVLFCLCVAFKLNGSSIGMWHEVLRGSGPAPGLLFFQPQRIRFDEWSVTTPSMLSQARHSPAFPVENSSLGAGRAPLLMSVPVAYYTTFFRPQHWGFFLFDFERGFSFYWCCKVFGLFLAATWLLRQIGIKSRSIVLFGAVWIFFSSFVQWWFSSPAMLPEMIASWAMATGFAIRFFSRSSRGELAIALAGFIFFAVNFVLCLYPGFQIPLLYLSAAIIIGVWLRSRSEGGAWRPAQGWVMLGAGIGLVTIALVPFWLSVADTLSIVAKTSYPGVYRSKGGELTLSFLLSGVIGFFESGKVVPSGYANICEASNFYPLCVAVWLIVIGARWRNKTLFDPLILTLSAALLLLSIYCVVPLPAWIGRSTLFSVATVTRLLLGIGLANILLSCVFLDRYQTLAVPRVGALSIAAGLWLCLALWLWFANPFPDRTRLALLLLINGVLVGLFFWERARPWFLSAFAALLVVNGASINPIMSGLSPLLNTEAFRRIDALRAADPAGGWVVYENQALPQLVKATGAPVLNGAKIVPDLGLMQQLDAEGSARQIYNRYATITALLPGSPGTVAWNLVYDDFYQIALPPDHLALRERGYNYLLFPREWFNASLHGFALIEKIEPGRLFVYKRLN